MDHQLVEAQRADARALWLFGIDAWCASVFDGLDREQVRALWMSRWTAVDDALGAEGLAACSLDPCVSRSPTDLEHASAAMDRELRAQHEARHAVDRDAILIGAVTADLQLRGEAFTGDQRPEGRPARAIPAAPPPLAFFRAGDLVVRVCYGVIDEQCLRIDPSGRRTTGSLNNGALQVKFVAALHAARIPHLVKPLRYVEINAGTRSYPCVVYDLPRGITTLGEIASELAKEQRGLPLHLAAQAMNLLWNGVERLSHWLRGTTDWVHVDAAGRLSVHPSLGGQRILGFPGFVYPECLTGVVDETTAGIDARVVLTLGIRMYQLLAPWWISPIKVMDRFRYPYAHARASLASLRPELDSVTCSLIDRCCAVDPAERPSIGEVRAFLAERAEETYAIDFRHLVNVGAAGNRASREAYTEELMLLDPDRLPVAVQKEITPEVVPLGLILEQHRIDLL